MEKKRNAGRRTTAQLGKWNSGCVTCQRATVYHDVYLSQTMEATCIPQLYVCWCICVYSRKNRNFENNLCLREMFCCSWGLEPINIFLRNKKLKCKKRKDRVMSWARGIESWNTTQTHQEWAALCFQWTLLRKMSANKVEISEQQRSGSFLINATGPRKADEIQISAALITRYHLLSSQQLRPSDDSDFHQNTHLSLFAIIQSSHGGNDSCHNEFNSTGG